MPETKVTLNNPEDSNSGYTIENPYATKIKFITDAVPEGFIEIPKITEPWLYLQFGGPGIERTV